MKYQVLIEETISQMFEVDAKDIDEAYTKIRNGYKTCDYVVENPNLEDTQCMIFDSDGKEPLTKKMDVL